MRSAWPLLLALWALVRAAATPASIAATPSNAPFGVFQTFTIEIFDSAGDLITDELSVQTKLSSEFVYFDCEFDGSSFSYTAEHVLFDLEDTLEVWYDGSLVGSETVLSAPAFDTVQTLSPLGSLGAEQNFGSSVAVDRSNLFVGASLAKAVYMYSPAGSEWTLEGTFAPDGDDAKYFGASVAITSSYIAIGAPGDSTQGPSSGAVFLYARTGSSQNSFSALYSPDPASYGEFGAAVAFAGNLLLVGSAGAPSAGVQGAGLVYVFACADLECTELQTLSEATPTLQNGFGAEVAAAGALAAVASAGSVSLFDLSSGAAELNGTIAHSGDAAGVGTNGTHVVVGEHQAARASVFAREGGVWANQTTLSGPDGSLFGRRVALSGGLLAVAAPGAELAGQDAGSLFLYTQLPNLTTWQMISRVDGGADAELGAALALSAAHLVASTTNEEAVASAYTGLASGFSGVSAVFEFSDDADGTISAELLDAAGAAVTTAEPLYASFDPLSLGAFPWDPALGLYSTSLEVSLAPLETPLLVCLAAAENGAFSVGCPVVPSALAFYDVAAVAVTPRETQVGAAVTYNITPLGATGARLADRQPVKAGWCGDTLTPATLGDGGVYSIALAAPTVSTTATLCSRMPNSANGAAFVTPVATAFGPAVAAAISPSDGVHAGETVEFRIAIFNSAGRAVTEFRNVSADFGDGAAGPLAFDAARAVYTATRVVPGGWDGAVAVALDGANVALSVAVVPETVWVAALAGTGALALLAGVAAALFIARFVRARRRARDTFRYEVNKLKEQQRDEERARLLAGAGVAPGGPASPMHNTGSALAFRSQGYEETPDTFGTPATDDGGLLAFSY